LALNDPVALFNEWFSEALAAGIEVPEAMTLATADAGGRPAARVLLRKCASVL
jgi:pyridoxamine 5'-phosphate oxidase